MFSLHNYGPSLCLLTIFSEDFHVKGCFVIFITCGCPGIVYTSHNDEETLACVNTRRKIILNNFVLNFFNKNFTWKILPYM